MNIIIPDQCPICNNLAKAYWAEVWRRDWKEDNIPYQEYIVQCTDLECYAEVSMRHDYRSEQIERACIKAWNNIPRDFKE